MNRSLIDTDILSEIAKAANPTVSRRAAAYRRLFGRSTFSAITVMEIARGYRKKLATDRLTSFLTSVAREEIIPFDREAAGLAGEIAGDLERTRMPIGLADPMIAATALSRGLVLATGNTAHFQRIRRLGYPLALDNWRQEPA